MKKVLLALVALGGVVVVACNDDDAAPGSVLAETGSDSGVDAPSCATSGIAELGRRACVPAAAKANAPLSIELEGSGCGSCYETYSCAVSVEGSAITISLRAEGCTPANALCDASCVAPRAVCAIPALVAGTYQVTATGEPSREVPRDLVVADGATETRCELGVPTGTVDLTPFSRSCTVETDCVAVTTDTCSPCACPTEAIAKSEQSRFDGAARAASSQCVPRDTQVVCAACPQATVTCGGGVCAIR